MGAAVGEYGVSPISVWEGPLATSWRYWFAKLCWPSCRGVFQVEEGVVEDALEVGTAVD